MPRLPPAALPFLIVRCWRRARRETAAVLLEAVGVAAWSHYRHYAFTAFGSWVYPLLGLALAAYLARRAERAVAPWRAAEARARQLPGQAGALVWVVEEAAPFVHRPQPDADGATGGPLWALLGGYRVLPHHWVSRHTDPPGPASTPFEVLQTQLRQQGALVGRNVPPAQQQRLTAAVAVATRGLDQDVAARPMPREQEELYSLKWAVGGYCLGLPFALVAWLGWAMPVAVGGMAAVLLTLRRADAALRHPFGAHPLTVPLAAYASAADSQVVLAMNRLAVRVQRTL